MTRSKKNSNNKKGFKLSRRWFAGGTLAGFGIALLRVFEKTGVAAHVSMKEASYYEPVDMDEKEKR